MKQRAGLRKADVGAGDIDPGGINGSIEIQAPRKPRATKIGGPLK